jgi:lysozyme family protein
MADFEIAYGETELHEGGYVDDPDDRGGETHLGISRKFHPNWVGWQKIDRIKAAQPEDYVRHVNDDPELVDLAKTFYREQFWRPVYGDQISDQSIANKVFDTAVNQGTGTSIQYLQESLNLLNRNQRNYGDIVVDRKMGPKTLAAFNQFLKLEKAQPDYLLKLLNLMQANRYVEIMKRDPTQQKFARGWLNRVNLR